MGTEEYIEQCKGDIVQDIIKIRLHMRKNCNVLCETAAAAVHYHNRACASMWKRQRQKTEKHKE